MGDAERPDALTGGDSAIEQPLKRIIDPLGIMEYGPRSVREGEKALATGLRAINEVPEFIERARTAWNSLLPELPRRNLMENVTIKWMVLHPYHKMKTTKAVNAWTNSRTEIYIRRPDSITTANAEMAYLRVLLYHEAWHIEQFATSGGPPDSYAMMMQHEEEAYKKTYEWLRNLSPSSPYSREMTDLMKQYIKPIKQRHGLFLSKIEEVENETSDPQKQNKKYQAFLLERDDPFLPRHDEIKELYGL